MKTQCATKSNTSIHWILIIASLLWIGALLTGCGSKKEDSGQAPAQPTVQTQQLPRQNMIVRVNQQTKQAEYMQADFDPSGDRRAMQTQAQDPRAQWAPVNQEAMINQQRGYPQAQDQNFYFIQDPQNFQGQQQNRRGQNPNPNQNRQPGTLVDDGPASQDLAPDNSNIRVDLGDDYYPATAYQAAYYDGGYQYGYHNYPYYDGSYYYGQQRYSHYYASNPYSYYANYQNFYYQPTYYSNYRYSYYTPCYYYQAPQTQFSYYYYSYWWN